MKKNQYRPSKSVLDQMANKETESRTKLFNSDEIKDLLNALIHFTAEAEEFGYIKLESEEKTFSLIMTLSRMIKYLSVSELVRLSSKNPQLQKHFVQESNPSWSKELEEYIKSSVPDMLQQKQDNNSSQEIPTDEQKYKS